MCASRTSEHTSITTYRSQSFRCPSDLRIATLLTNPNPVGAVLRCTHPNAICIPNRTGSSAETLDMDNPENLVILKILVQTDAVRFGVPFCLCLLFSYHAPFSPQTVRVCHCCTCARIAHLNTPAGRYNEFLSKTPHNDLFKITSFHNTSRFQKMLPCAPQMAYFQ